jgi:hypothetical protein
MVRFTIDLDGGLHERLRKKYFRHGSLTEVVRVYLEGLVSSDAGIERSREGGKSSLLERVTPPPATPKNTGRVVSDTSPSMNRAMKEFLEKGGKK